MGFNLFISRYYRLYFNGIVRGMSPVFIIHRYTSESKGAKENDDEGVYIIYNIYPILQQQKKGAHG